MIDQRQTDICKTRYNGKYTKVDIMAVQETADGKMG